MANQDITEEKREMFREFGRQGGKKAAEMLGSQHMAEIGRRGRAKQLENQTPGEPRTPRQSSEKRGGGAGKSAKTSAQPPVERADDPLLNL